MSVPHRYVFVGGLHRSGTSLVARLLEEHPQISGIQGAPVPENEGCYLQGAIPHTARHGIPCHFATDLDQHLVEGCAFDTLATRERLEADWAPWFDAAKPWRVEKSPVNLTRMRLYQALFPLSQFIVVVRRPGFVAAAMRKWTDMGDDAVMRHWAEAHSIVEEDLTYIHRWLLVRYEDLVRNPVRERERMFDFLGLPVCPSALAIRDGNDRYRSTVSDAASDEKPFGYGPRAVAGRHVLRTVNEKLHFGSSEAHAAGLPSAD